MKKQILLLLSCLFATLFTISVSAQNVVGTINGQHAVSPTGAAVYNIPINCLPGTNGLQPNISLSYNSQAGDGIVGIGWQLSGLSMITRMGKNIATSSAIGPLDWTKNSRLSLDGNRLDKKFSSNPNPTNDSVEYVLEQNIYAKVMAYKVNDQGPTYFRVYHKNGQIWTYGNDNQFSRYYITTSGSRRLGWMLTSIQDANGNTITFTYEGDLTGSFYNSHRIKNITYSSTNNTPSSGYYIGFEYETRPDAMITYMDNLPFQQQKKLASIVVKENQASAYEYRRYNLQYSLLSSEKSCLTKITEIAPTGEQLNSTTIEWNETEKAMDEYAIPNIAGINDNAAAHNKKWYAIDYDGDGLTEILSCHVTAHSSDENKHYFDIYKPTVNNQTDEISFSKIQSYQKILKKGLHIGDNPLRSCYFKSTSTPSIFYPIFWIDYGDNNRGSSGSGESSIDKGNFGIKDVNTYSTLFSTQMNSSSSSYPAYTYGDINNDGFDDFIIIEKNEATTRTVHIAWGNNVNDTTITKYSWSLDKVPERIFLADFNGDGLKDICVVTKGGYSIWKNDGGTTGPNGIVRPTFTLKKSGKEFNADNYCALQPGDFNGDGLIDFVLNKTHTNEWYSAIGKPNWGGFTVYRHNNISVTSGCSPSSTKKTDKCLVVDFDNNGKSDLILFESNDNASIPFADRYYVAWYASNGTSFDLVQRRSPTSGNTPTYYYHDTNMLGDFDGNGTIDFMTYGLGFGNTGHLTKDTKFHFYSTGMPNGAGAVQSITDGMGNKASFSYKSLTNNNIYTRSGTNNNGSSIKELAAPLHVVSRSMYSNNYTPKSAQQYTYTDAIFQTQGVGFIGFKKMIINDSILKIRTENYNTLNVSYAILYPDSSVVKTADGELIRSTRQQYKLSPASQSYLLYMSKETNRDFLTGTVTQTTATKTNTEIFTTTYANGVSEKKEISWINRGSWCANVPAWIQHTRTTPAGTYTRKTTYEYDNRGNLLKEITDPGNVNSLTNEYAYDKYGNVIATKSIANGQTRQTGTYTYSLGGRYPTSHKDVLGNTVNYNYDSKNGLLMSKTDYTGTTTYEYDAFGRMKKVTYPDGNTMSQTLSWNNTGSISYVKEVKASGQPTEWTWYNSYGEEVRQAVSSLDGKRSTVNTNRKLLPGMLAVSHPYIVNTDGSTSGPPDNKEVYKYDKYGRLSSHLTYRSLASKVETTYAYSGLQTIITSPTGRTVTVMDAAGQKLSVTGPSNHNKVSYEYYPSGLVKKASPLLGKEITMEYDLQGNRTKITDPDAGVITSKYNGFGELIETRQAVHNAGQWVITTYSYNNANGLLMQKNINGEITTYSYDDKKRLSSVKINGKHQVNYEYDDYGRTTYIIENIEGSSYTTQTEYDAYGRVWKETYPSGYYIQNNYDGNGLLVSVQDPSGVKLWEALEVNAAGQYTVEKVGGLTRQASYSRFDGLPEYELCDSVFNFQYQFDNKRNLQQKKNMLTGQTEKYTFDGSDRLTAWNIHDINSDALLQQNGLTYIEPANRIVKKGDYGIGYGEFGLPANAVSSITTSVDKAPRMTQSIAYTDFKKTASIHEGDKLLQISYGTDQQRRKSVYSEDNTVKLTRYYVGNYEEERNAVGNIRKIHYISGGDGLVALFVQNTNAPDSLYYAFTDYVGNLIAITSADGSVIQRLAYDPWGNRRNPDDWTQAADTTINYITERGYTLHEHLDKFKLINMNGRMYDPILSCFLSPDPYIQMPDNWFNYNRYNYCLGNPLRYTDPDGEFIHLIIGAIIGGTINVIMNGGKIENTGDFFAYFGIGAGIGALSAAGGAWATGALNAGGIITGAGTGALSGSAIGATSGFLQNGLNNVLQGNNFMNSWQQSTLDGAFLGGITGFVSGGIEGYNIAKESGKNMWWGGDIKYGRGKWSFFNSELPYETINWDIKDVGSSSLNDCMPTSFAEAADYFGGDTNYYEYKSITNYEKNIGVRTNKAAYQKMLSENFHTSSLNISALETPAMAQQIKDAGGIINVNMTRHIDNLRSIKYYHSGKVIMNFRIGSYNLSSANNNWWFYVLRNMK